MALEFFAMYESFFKALHDDFFFVGELIWMLPVHGRENRISEFVFNAVDNNGIGITIYQVQQFTVFEFERRVFVDKLPLLFGSLRLDRILQRLSLDRP